VGERWDLRPKKSDVSVNVQSLSFLAECTLHDVGRLRTNKRPFDR